VFGDFYLIILKFVRICLESTNCFIFFHEIWLKVDFIHQPFYPSISFTFWCCRAAVLLSNAPFFTFSSSSYVFQYDWTVSLSIHCCLKLMTLFVAVFTSYILFLLHVKCLITFSSEFDKRQYKVTCSDVNVDLLSTPVGFTCCWQKMWLNSVIRIWYHLVYPIQMMKFSHIFRDQT
jgi:hypothetical protein